MNRAAWVRKARKTRDRANKTTEADPEKRAAARVAWERVWKEGQEHQATRLRCENARVAMLEVLADGGTVEQAESAGMSALRPEWKTEA